MTTNVHNYPQETKIRRPGDRWMIRGPCEYVPPVEVEVVAQKKAIPLDENEGIYVRDIKSGKVRAVCGQTYMLNQDEELWEKILPPAVEDLLSQGLDPLADRGTRGSSSGGRYWAGQNLNLKNTYIHGVVGACQSFESVNAPIEHRLAFCEREEKPIVLNVVCR